MNLSRLSKLGLLVVCSFILLSLLARFLFPFADEPDWTVRAPLVLFGEHPFWSPYLIFQGWLTGLNIEHSDCQVQASPMSLWAYIPLSCSEGVEQVFIRWVLTLFCLAPMLLIIIFRRGFINLMFLVGARLSSNEWNNRIDSLALSLIFPGMLFYLGVLAEEQLYLIVALYIFLFWGFWLVLLVLSALLLSIDFGNSIVTIFFIGSLWFTSVIRSYGRKFFFLTVISVLLIAYVVGFKFVEFFLNIGFITGDLAQKSEAMLSALDGSELLTKYPVILRPVITFMSFVFLTPTGVKVPLLYPVFGLSLVFLFFKVIEKGEYKLDVFFFVPIAVVIFFVFLFPTYGNAKYYMFMLPFLMYVCLNFFNRKNIFYLFIASNLFVFVNLILYRL